MKKLLSIFGLFICGSLAAQTQEQLKRHNIKANLLSPIFNTINISYQHLIKDDRSFQIGVSYMDFDDFGSNENGYNDPATENLVRGFNITADYRIAFNDRGLGGAYVGPFARYQNYNRKYSNTNATAKEIAKEDGDFQSLGLGFVIGYQFVFRNVISFDIFGGPAYQVLISDERTATLSSGNPTDPFNQYLSDDIPNRYLDGYGLRTGISIGFMF